MTSATASAEYKSGRPHGSLATLALGALGVVYGDIGTSPLYTMKAVLDTDGLDRSADVALGTLSLIVWTLIITTSIKYVAVVMRADNEGEGGILALMSLIVGKSGVRVAVISAGILGAALLYGDGAITPAISVLSALEGLKTAAPAIAPWVVTLAVAILVGLFALQPQGSGRIGKLFGPIMTLWFVTIAVLGVASLVKHPGVVVALDPRYGLALLFTHGWSGFLVLGAIFLCATGAEALYADMGHFGPRPIRLSWYGLVLPALLLNYAGQTGLVIDGAVPKDANPFYLLCPDRLQLALVALSTVAAIIASQAIISGAFSMTRQAIQLGLCPRLHIKQTSAEGYGQIYVGFVNWALMALTLTLTVAFRTSDNLSAAYGIAVSLTMLLTSVLVFLAMREVWRWSVPVSVAVAGMFIVVDLAFVSANLMKVLQGGWVPLVAATMIFFLMSTWRQGRMLLRDKLERDTLPLADFIRGIKSKTRVPGTAVYLTSRTDMVPVPLLHNLKHNKVLHQRIVLLHVTTEPVPRVHFSERVATQSFGEEFYAVTAHYGFMEHPNIPQALDHCAEKKLHFEMMDMSFFVGRLHIVPVGRSRWRRFEVAVFEFMHRNAQAATEFFRIPAGRVVELGGQIEI
ncbi:MAG TPA: KUP/HAK/KT family potassium transporter [Xanthobacteraceae bacterium]|nr:KUP/HAK/KT family potassium transporter [Xanthobacteraceae bacterium]